MVTVKVYDVFNNTRSFVVKDMAAGREYAKRIIMEGLWYIDDGAEIFMPVHNIVKVKVEETKEKK